MNKLKSIRLCSKARTILFSVISILLIAIVIRFLVQYHKEYEIVTYGDSITEQFNWQTYLEDYYNESILNLGIGSSAFTNDGYSPAALDIKNFVPSCFLSYHPFFIQTKIPRCPINMDIGEVVDIVKLRSVFSVLCTTNVEAIGRWRGLSSSTVHYLLSVSFC